MPAGQVRPAQFNAHAMSSIPLTLTGIHVGVAVPPGFGSQSTAALVQPVSLQNPSSFIPSASLIVMHSVGTNPQSIATVHGEYMPAAG